MVVTGSASTSDRSGVMTNAQSAAVREKARLGIRVAIGLGVLTIVEFVLAVNIGDPLLWLLPFVVAKGWLILDYFMHIRHVFDGRGR